MILNNSNQGDQLEARIRCHLLQQLGAGQFAIAANQLLSKRRRSRTITRKATQLASCERFMSSHNLSYPDTGTNLACWIEDIHESRIRRSGTSISAPSLAGYLSGIRTSLVALGHRRMFQLSDCFALREIYNAYVEWDGDIYGADTSVRIAVPADAIAKMIDSALRTSDLAMVVLARCHGIRAD